jgi:hypothetical protein
MPKPTGTDVKVAEVLSAYTCFALILLSCSAKLLSSKAII